MKSLAEALRGWALVEAVKETVAEMALSELVAMADAVEDELCRRDKLTGDVISQTSRDVVGQVRGHRETFQLERVRCGKPGCHCMKGGNAHGPYWYAYWSERGKTRSRYVGKKLQLQDGQQKPQASGDTSQ